MLNQPSEFNSLDDLLYSTYKEILDRGLEIESKRGKNFEIINYSATLLNPRIRTSLSLDRKLVKSKFAEFAWYLSKVDNKNYIVPYISAYSKEEQENNRILGAYGSKIFGISNNSLSQFDRIVEQINKRESTKQAYLSISNSIDYKVRDGVFSSPPCTIGLQFLVRKSKLNLVVYMRSNDAYFGLPHDLFCFTMLQELVAFKVNCKLGTYTHVVTSMHVYQEHLSAIKSYLNEGFCSPIEMPEIKQFNSTIADIVSNEFDLQKDSSSLNQLDVDDYWKDFILFSKKYDESKTSIEKWKDSFQNKQMLRIAENSLSK